MRPGKKMRRGGDGGSYWISYSDMMAGMLFTFALILFMAVYQLVDLQQKKTIELETKEAQLSTQQSLLIDQEAELKDKEELLATTPAAADGAGRKPHRAHRCAAEPVPAAEQDRGAGGAAGRAADADRQADRPAFAHHRGAARRASRRGAGRCGGQEDRRHRLHRRRAL